jgi:SAM-dependent methyltransferase
MKSQTGEGWKNYYQTDTLSWSDPKKIGPERFSEFSHSEWIKKILHYTNLKPAKGARVLEAGCGTAFYSLTLASIGFDVDAFDYNAGALEFAHKLEKTARQVNPEMKIRIQIGNLLDIQSESNVYDLVFNQAVLEYFCNPEERKKALSEMVRVARPGGWVAIIVQHTGHPFRKYWEWVGWPGYVDQPPVALQTPALLIKELEMEGLINVTADGIYPWKGFFFWPAWYLRWKWAEHGVYLLGRILARYGYLPRVLRCALAVQFLVVGRKL